MVVRFEELVTEPALTLQAGLAKLGLSPNPALLEQLERGQARHGSRRSEHRGPLMSVGGRKLQASWVPPRLAGRAKPAPMLLSREPVPAPVLPALTPSRSWCC